MPSVGAVRASARTAASTTLHVLRLIDELRFLMERTSQQSSRRLNGHGQLLLAGIVGNVGNVGRALPTADAVATGGIAASGPAGVNWTLVGAAGERPGPSGKIFPSEGTSLVAEALSRRGGIAHRMLQSLASFGSANAATLQCRCVSRRKRLSM